MADINPVLAPYKELSTQQWYNVTEQQQRHQYLQLFDGTSQISPGTSDATSGLEPPTEGDNCVNNFATDLRDTRSEGWARRDLAPSLAQQQQQQHQHLKVASVLMAGDRALMRQRG